MFDEIRKLIVHLFKCECKGTLNPPNTSNKRPPAPKGSGSDRVKDKQAVTGVI
jgi:hypothetical protein